MTVASNCQIILQFLLDNGVQDLYVSPIYVNSEEQYFDDVMQFTDEEVFADVGAYDGMTTYNFLKHMRGKFKQIYLFEPDSNRLHDIEKNLLNINNIEIYNIGAPLKTKK